MNRAGERQKRFLAVPRAGAALLVFAVFASGCRHAPGPLVEEDGFQGAEIGPGKAESGEWTWEGERLVAGMVEIPAGITLRLGPGAVLKFDYTDNNGDGFGDAGLHVRGRVVAEGGQGAPIIFTSARSSPRPGDWAGLLLDESCGSVFSRCLIEYARYALHAHFSQGRVIRSRLERNLEGTRLGDSQFEIGYCLVKGNLSKGINYRACSNHIHHNLITANGHGVFLFETDSATVLEHNNIYGNEGYDLRLGDFYRGKVELGVNWWGTAEIAAIQKRIYDDGEDQDLEKVDFTPAAGPFETGWSEQ